MRAPAKSGDRLPPNFWVRGPLFIAGVAWKPRLRRYEWFSCGCFVSNDCGTIYAEEKEALGARSSSTIRTCGGFWTITWTEKSQEPLQQEASYKFCLEFVKTVSGSCPSWICEKLNTCAQHIKEIWYLFRGREIYFALVSGERNANSVTCSCTVQSNMGFSELFYKLPSHRDMKLVCQNIEERDISYLWLRAVYNILSWLPVDRWSGTKIHSHHHDRILRCSVYCVWVTATRRLYSRYVRGLVQNYRLYVMPCIKIYVKTEIWSVQNRTACGSM